MTLDKADAQLLIEWVGLIAPLICDGEPDDAIAANLARQMREDLAGRDDSGIKGLISLWAEAMREVTGELFGK